MITAKDIKPGNIINHISSPKNKEMVCYVSEDEFTLFLLTTGNMEYWVLRDNNIKNTLKWFDSYEVFYREE